MIERRVDGDVHIEACDGFFCPCFMDGRAVSATCHLDVLDHFCRVDPDLVRERLALAAVPDSPGSGGSRDR